MVTNTQPEYGTGARELRGVDAYMQPKIRASQLIEPGSVHELSAVGDTKSALITKTMRIGLGPGGSMATLARAVAYLLDDHEKIKEERDMFFVLP